MREPALRLRIRLGVTARTATAAAAAALALGVGTWLFLDALEPPPLEIGGYVLATPRDPRPSSSSTSTGHRFGRTTSWGTGRSSTSATHIAPMSAH
jgi:hypothetical protein